MPFQGTSDRAMRKSSWFRSCMPQSEYSLSGQCAADARLTFCRLEAKARKVYSTAGEPRWDGGAYRSLMTYTRPHSGLMSRPCACLWSIWCACCSTCIRRALLKCSGPFQMLCRAAQIDKNSRYTCLEKGWAVDDSQNVCSNARACASHSTRLAADIHSMSLNIHVARSQVGLAATSLPLQHRPQTRHSDTPIHGPLPAVPKHTVLL